MQSSTPRRPRATDRFQRRRERATAMVLVPAVTLVLLALAAIAVDLSLVHASHRAIHRVVSSAAQDGAQMIDERQLQLSGDLVVDPRRASEVVHAHLEAVELPGELVGVTVDAVEDHVDVRLLVDVPHVFRSGLPGHDDTTLVDVRARGRLHR